MASYETDIPGIEFQRRGGGGGGFVGEIFRTRPDLPWSPNTFLYNGYRVYFLPLTNTKVKESVQLYLLFPLWALWDFMSCYMVSFSFNFGAIPLPSRSVANTINPNFDFMTFASCLH